MPEMVEYWVLGGWQVCQWRDDDGDVWFTVNSTDDACNPARARYASLYETLPVVAALAYVGSGVETEREAWELGFAFARQTGMHTWDGHEWVHRAPRET